MTTGFCGNARFEVARYAALGRVDTHSLGCGKVPKTHARIDVNMRE